MSFKPWREVAIPHEDVLKGTFQQAEFAADISRVHDKQAVPEYQDPILFFQRTFITEGMRLLMDSVIKRLAGKGGDPVMQLQTAFGGGKTHTLLAVYHLSQGMAAADKLQGIAPILSAAGVSELPKAKIAVLDGNKLSPNQPQDRSGCKVHTMWGEIAWQLGGAAAYEQVKQADISGTSPGKEVLAKLLAAHAPCVILMDELVAYIRQFEEGKSLSGGTYDSNLSFIQALCEAMKAVPNAILLVSLPESEREAGSQRGINALKTLEHYFGRVQALWKPVATEEAFEIVRRRLFTNIKDTASVEAVCRGFADFYVANAADFPRETQDSHYFERIKRAYPIHPEVFERLYEDWSSLGNFQRTRGVLKFMAKVIHRLWKDGNNDLMIMPGSLPLYDADVRNEAIYYLPQGWDPVLERDIDGERSVTSDIENQRPVLGAGQVCRRLARTIFLGSAPDSSDMTTAKRNKGVELERAFLGSIQPGQVAGLYRDGLRALTDELQYLSNANGKFWFDTRPNLRREMEERKRRFQDKEDVYPVIRGLLQRVLGHGVFDGVHVFTTSSDVPDDGYLRLVVLSPDANMSRAGQNIAEGRAAEILKSRGEQPRQKQNRLIFLAPDTESIGRLKDQARAMLAWQSIVDDIKDMKLNVDQFQSRQSGKSLEESNEALKRMVCEAYKWLLAPMQEAKPGQGISEIKWEKFPLNASSGALSGEIERVMKDNELLILEWAPIHLANLLKTWFWKDGVKEAGALDVWQKMSCYLYFPRLKNEDVYRAAIVAGALSRDFFGLAYGKNGDKYDGFSLGRSAMITMDGALLLIEQSTAIAYEAVLKASQPEVVEPAPGVSQPGQSPSPTPVAPSTGNLDGAIAKVVKKKFFGSVNLDKIRHKLDFNEIADEIIKPFASRSDVGLKISIEISADSYSNDGFDENLQRVVKENSKTLKFRNAEFE